MRKSVSLIVLLLLGPYLALAEPAEMTEPPGSSSGFAELDRKCPINMPLLEFYKCMEKEKEAAQGDQCKMQAIRCHIKQRSDFAASTCAQIKDPAAYWQCFQNNVRDQAIAQNPNINVPALLSFIGLATALANNGSGSVDSGDRSHLPVNLGDRTPVDPNYNPYSDPDSPLYNQDIQVDNSGVTASSF